MRQAKRRKKVVKRKKVKQVVQRRGGKKVAKRRIKESIPSSPARKKTPYFAGFMVKHPEIVWKGYRDGKTFRLTGEYTIADLISNFEMAFEIGGAWGYYRAREWFAKLFKPFEYANWPLIVLRNCYRALYNKDAPNLHPVILQYLVHGKLSLRWLKEEVNRDGAKEHEDMYSTWKNLIPKIIARQKAIRKQDWQALSEMTRDGIFDSMEYYDRYVAEKKGAITMAKKGKKGKKVRTIENTKNESWKDSIAAIGLKVKGVIKYNRLLKKVQGRRIKLGLLEKSKASNLLSSPTAIFRRCREMSEEGLLRIVADKEYCFDGSKKSMSTSEGKKDKKVKASKKVKKIKKLKTAKKVKKGKKVKKAKTLKTPKTKKSPRRKK